MTFPALFPSAPSAAGVLLTARSTGRSLFLLRSDDGYWGTPGGHVERGETPYVAMLRELEEETGRVVIDRESLRAPVRVGSYLLFFATVPREFAPTLNEEHVDWRWASLASPPQPLHPGAVKALKKEGP
ncbi:MAG: hypothetical protein AMXMBFR56_68310 [Polyangiaceae bacterium]